MVKQDNTNDIIKKKSRHQIGLASERKYSSEFDL